MEPITARIKGRGNKVCPKIAPDSGSDSRRGIVYARWLLVNVTGSDLKGHVVTGVGHDLVTLAAINRYLREPISPGITVYLHPTVKDRVITVSCP